MTVITASRPLSLQLYTLRESMAADAEDTWRFIGGLGLDHVEPHRIVGEETQAVLRESCARYGLSMPSAHMRMIGGDCVTVFESARALGIGTVIQPTCDRGYWEDDAAVRRLARDLTEVAQQASEYGIRVGYHNHAFEFEHVDAPLERLAEYLGAGSNVVLELDTYWAAVGGADPVALLQRLGEKVAFIHVKDGPITPDPMEQQPLGEGKMPVEEILAAAPHALAVLELDAYAGDMRHAVAAGVKYMKERS